MLFITYLNTCMCVGERTCECMPLMKGPDQCTILNFSFTIIYFSHKTEFKCFTSKAVIVTAMNIYYSFLTIS